MNTASNFKWKVLPAVIAAAFLAGCGGSGDDDAGPTASAPVFRSAGLVQAAPTVTTNATGQDVRNVCVLTEGGPKTLTTTAVTPANAAVIQAALAPGNLVDWLASDTGAVTVPTDPTQTFNVVLAKGKSSDAQFNLQKYGASVARHANAPGPMVAAGWIYNKTGSTITVGDGSIVTADQAGRAYTTPIKRYEETYTVAPDAQVFNVNTDDYSKSTVSTLAAVPVTANYNYATTARQAAYLLFDNNYQNAANAKVVAIWYFTPQSKTDGKPVWDVPTQSPMLADKGTDPISGQTYVAINATGVSAAPYTRSTEPFEMVKNTLYYVGDNEVASYVLKADMGTADTSDDKVIKIDAGWPNSGYQYFKNMELMGVDPRSVTDLWLTHGHGDHYGTAVEHLKMMDNAGKTMNLWASKEDVIGVKGDLQGNVWDIPGALPDTETVLRARTNNFYEYDKWYDYGNVQIMVIWAPGHTPGTTNMLFRVKNPADGKFVIFGYHGGYGVNGLNSPTPANGWRRLSFQHGFSYLQNTVDVDFVAPQHTNQYPIVEVFQGLKAYNRDPANANKPLTMLDALTTKVFDSPAIGGTKVTTEFANQLEKRRSVVSYKASDVANRTYKSIETSGPFKPGREAGLTDIRATLLDSGKIVQGFVGAQNKNPAIPLLANGIVVPTDSYVDDPTGFFVQVSIDVQDTVYKGYVPPSFAQNSPGLGASITYDGGPVESVHAAKGTFHPPEVLRTQRLKTLAEAQAVLAKIQKGRTVTISLNPGSEIVVPADVNATFR